MTHINRNRLTVDRNGAWRLWTNTIPASAEVLGTVTRTGRFSDTGALVRFTQTGMYVQVNAGVVRSLPQDKVIAAVGAQQ